MALFHFVERNPNCTRCMRYQNARNVCVMGELVGDPPVELIVVGEAPGREEDIQCRPFVGPSGKMIREMLANLVSCYYITNAVKCFGDTPQMREVSACRDYLVRELEQYPQVPILAVGLTAARALGYTEARMQFLVNTVVFSGSWNRKIGFIIHPAAVLRAPMKFKKVWEAAPVTVTRLLHEEQRDILQEFTVCRDTIPEKCPSLWTLDTETTGLDMFGELEQKMSVDPKCNEDRADIIALAIYDHDTGTVHVCTDRKKIIGFIPTILQWWLQNPPYAHNANFDLHILQQEALRHKYSVPLQMFPQRDTMVHVALTNPDAPKGLARNLEVLNIKKYWGDEKKYQVENLAEYVAADAYGVYVLREAYQEAENDAEYDFLQSLVSAAQLAERIGIPISLAHAKWGEAYCLNGMEEVTRVFGYGHHVFRSPARLGQMLGVSSTSKEALAELRRQIKDEQKLRLIDGIEQYRKYLKLLAYYQSIIALRTVNELGWEVVHAHLNALGASGGRMSSSSFSKHFGLNLQNFPPEARHVFQPPQGYVLVEADYSQIELRVVARIAGVREMIQAFERGEDLHEKTALMVFGRVDKELRRKAKAVNFGFLYGMSPEGFRIYAQTEFGLDLSEEECEQVRQAFFRAYPELIEYYQNTERNLVRYGYVESLFGRRRYFLPTPEQIRAAINFRVQSTAAEICLRAMIRLAKSLTPLGIYVCNQVHDSLLFVVPERMERSVLPLIQEAMEHTELGVFPVEVKSRRYTPAPEIHRQELLLPLFEQS